jgi:hypothetical protein
MEIKRKSDGLTFWICGVSREVQQMPARFSSEVVTWFLIWDNQWVWVKAEDYEPYDSGF